MAEADPAQGQTLICVEVAWAQAGDVQFASVSLPPGASIADALAAAAAQAGVVFAAEQDTGIWGRLQLRSQALVHGDRVELYAPLKVDPKKARRARFAKQGAGRAGLFAKSKQGARAR